MKPAAESLLEIINYIRNSKVVGTLTKKKDNRYYDVVSAFDIEVSKAETGSFLKSGERELRSFMYIWQYSVDGIYTVYGRTWEDFTDFFLTLSSMLEYKLLVYVHNLSYEFSFIRGIYDFKNEDIFFMDERKPLYFRMYSFLEFRCSYRLFNMNLERVMQAEEVPEEYQKTELDYTTIRYPWTQLTQDELKYCRNDVLGLCLAIRHRLEKTGDDVSTIPLTSTGYIRRMMKEATKSYRDLFKWAAPDPFSYLLLRSAFRGGNTHANRKYSGVTCYNVHSVDVTSSYPYCLLCREYPLTGFRYVKLTPEEIRQRIRNRRHALLLHIRMYDIKTEHPIPYLSISRCIDYLPKYRDVKKDNGRILQADMVELSVTDIDYKIITETYTYSRIEYLHIYESDYLPLPRPAADVIKKLFYNKCTLKGKDSYLYARSKELLNACYGMAAQDIINNTIAYNGGNYVVQKEAVSTYRLMKNTLRNALPYAVGVWCTAYAREHLQRGFDVVTSQGGKIVYCDTDSIKYVGNVSFDDLNAGIAKKSYTVNYEGKDFTLGTFAIEETADYFKTLGAKKYVSQYGDELSITIAGVPKKAGAMELKQAGGISAFQKGFVFHAGKLMSVYNDNPFTFNIDGRTIISKSDVTLYETTYTVGITQDYQELLDEMLTYIRTIDIMEINKQIREGGISV